VGKGAEGRPFSPESRPLPTWQRVVLVEDPRDGGLWRYDAEAEPAGFSPIPLPGGDRLVRLLAPRNLPASLLGEQRAAALVVQGARGHYLLERSGFRPLQLPPSYALEEYPRPDVQPDGLLGLDVHLPSPSGGVFHHVFQPRTAGERAIAGLYRGTTLLRPPVLALAGAWADRERAFELGPALLLDRPVILGDRLGLAAVAALSLLLAALSYRRLRKLGASARRCRYWAVAIALGGLPVLGCYIVIERPRAWQPMPAEPDPRPATLLLQGT
jgi:hypothetical protein